jgi:hypothetical protein
MLFVIVALGLIPLGFVGQHRQEPTAEGGGHARAASRGRGTKADCTGQHCDACGGPRQGALRVK